MSAARGAPLEFELYQGGELVWITDSLMHEVLRVPPDAVDDLLARAN